MSRYTQLRHAGYYRDGLTDAERQEIADEVDGKPKPAPKPAPAEKPVVEKTESVKKP